MKSHERLVKQVKALPFIGALQVQFSNISLYLALYSSVALTLTLWMTTIINISWWPEWMTLPVYLLLAAGVVLIIMFLDYKFVYPSRMAFINEQACKHENPAMDLLKEIQAVQKRQAAELKSIRNKLGIKRVRK